MTSTNKQLGGQSLEHLIGIVDEWYEGAALNVEPDFEADLETVSFDGGQGARFHIAKTVSKESYTPTNTNFCIKHVVAQMCFCKIKKFSRRPLPLVYPGDTPPGAVEGNVVYT